MSETKTMTDPSPQELQAWADEAQACIDSGEVIITDHRKAHATVMALRSYAAFMACRAKIDCLSRGQPKDTAK